MPDLVVSLGLEAAIDRGLKALLSRQRADGSWDGFFLPSVSATAQLILFKQKLNQQDSSHARALEWIVSQQNDSGGWGDRRGLEDVPTVSHICYEAVRRGLPQHHRAVVAAANYIKRVEPIKHGTVWLPYITYWGLVPDRKFRPLLPLPAFYALRELLPWGTLMRVVISADILMALQIYQRSGRARPWHAALRRTVLTSTLRDRQREGEFAGSWLEFPLVTINILACLLDLGYSRNEPLVRDGLDWLERWRTPEGGLGQVVAFNIWETCLSALLLQRIDRPGLQEKIKKAVRFLAASQREDGASTWDSRLGKSSYADFDSTSYSALVRARSGEPINLGQVNTLLLKQLKNGGCGMFGRESLVPIHPYLKSCLDATCHVNNYLVFTFGRDSVPVRASVRWIMRNQNKDGSWTGVWYMRKTYGIDCALESLVLAGIPPDHPSIQAGCGWLKRAQNSDGGWGEDWCGQPHQSTVEQTAYAVHALAVAGEEISSAVLQRAITYLLKHQQPDGHWPAAQVGTFFHRMSGTYNTPSYPDIVALHALAAVQSVAAQSPR